MGDEHFTGEFSSCGEIQTHDFLTYVILLQPGVGVIKAATAVTMTICCTPYAVCHMQYAIRH